MRSERAIRIGLRVVLALSLLLNAVALGAVWAMLSFRADYNLENVALPRPERRAVRAAIRDRRDEVRAPLMAVAEARRAFVTAAEAEPYDPAAARAALAEVRQRSTELQSALQGIMLDALEADR
ncbi:periplasmic heavy metal sensor [Jannaschia sp. KMU-145]|uniref:periplasmic heavy metal sensor n=1 Tax=Jannaschia halovivens TaxID=3388667 RepID=UPI00396B448B